MLTFHDGLLPESSFSAFNALSVQILAWKVLTPLEQENQWLMISSAGQIFIQLVILRRYSTWLGNGGNNLTSCCIYRLLFSIFQFVLTLSYIILYKVVVEALPHVQNSTFEDKPGLSTGHQTPLQVSGKIILYKNNLMLLILVNVYIEKETHWNMTDDITTMVITNGHNHDKHQSILHL